jgi:hypothetical protein
MRNFRGILIFHGHFYLLSNQLTLITSHWNLLLANLPFFYRLHRNHSLWMPFLFRHLIFDFVFLVVLYRDFFLGTVASAMGVNILLSWNATLPLLYVFIEFFMVVLEPLQNLFHYDLWTDTTTVQQIVRGRLQKRYSVKLLVRNWFDEYLHENFGLISMPLALNQCPTSRGVHSLTFLGM